MEIFRSRIRLSACLSAADVYPAFFVGGFGQETEKSPGLPAGDWDTSDFPVARTFFFREDQLPSLKYTYW
jgi:hypothetical protein